NRSLDPSSTSNAASGDESRRTLDMSTQTHAETGAVPSVVPEAVTTIVPAVGRGLISSLFILSGLSKLAAPAMTIGYIQSAGLPLPPVAFALSAFVEIVGGIALLLGYRTHPLLQERRDGRWPAARGRFRRRPREPRRPARLIPRLERPGPLQLPHQPRR